MRFGLAAPALIIAVLLRNSACVDGLVSSPAGGGPMSSYHEATAFFQACRVGDHHEVRHLLRRAPGLTQARDGRGRTGLHLAAKHGRRKVVELLIDEGANPKLPDKQHMLPQHMAFDEGYTELGCDLRDYAKRYGDAYPVLTPAGVHHDSVHRPSSERAVRTPSAQRGMPPPSVSAEPYESVLDRGGRNSSASQQTMPPGADEIRCVSPLRIQASMGLGAVASQSEQVEEYEVFFRVATPGRADTELKLLSTARLCDVSMATGLRTSEPHQLQWKERILRPEAQVWEVGFPHSSETARIVLEQRPLIVYLKVVTPPPECAGVFVKLRTDQPMSKILNAPGMDRHRTADAMALWDGHTLDLRNTPGVYNIPSNVEDPPVVQFVPRPAKPVSLAPSIRRVFLP